MTAAAPMLLRVRVQDAWDEVELEVSPDTSVEAVKDEALNRFRIGTDRSAYVVKFRGAEIIDERRTVAEAGLVPNAALIIMPRRRRPVRSVL